MADPARDDRPDDAIRGPSGNQPPRPADVSLEAALNQGGPLDAMPPGPVLAAFLTEASRAGLAQLGDNALLGLIRGWRRVASLAAAAELAAVYEFSKRRYDQAKADGARDSTALDAADVELAAALTLTSRGAQLLMDRAGMQHDLPATGAALTAGQIDWPRALVLFNGLAGQDPNLARRIEQRLIGRAPQQTTGQLGAALNRALLAADPEAAERRRQREEEHARIERGPEPGGATALLAGRCLPVTETVTAWNRITALAHQLRATGADGNLDQLRVHVYLALLNGQAINAPPADAQSPGSADSPAVSPDASGRPAELTTSRITGHIDLTVPLGTVAGYSDAPGHLGGFGPITASAARQLADGALGQPGVRWCVTVTNDHGEAVGHGCAARIQPIGASSGEMGDPGRARAAPRGSGWKFTVKLTALAGLDCDHTRESPHYRPPPSLSHLVQTRNVCCTAPGCRMAASACDDDHTAPFDQGGRTCECNLGPLCRYHHRVKHARGWHLTQPEPGVFTWNTPSGRLYTTGPTHRTS